MPVLANICCCSETPGHHKSAARQRRHRGSALVVVGELVDPKFIADGQARGRQDFGIDIQQRVRAGLIETGPDHHDVAVVKHGHGGIDLETAGAGEGADRQVGGGQKRVAGREVACENVLVAFHAALPHKHRTAVFQHRHTRIFLVVRALRIHARIQPTGSGQGAIQPAGADAPAAPIRDIVLPDHKTAAAGNGGIREHLVARQRIDHGVFGAVGGVVIGLGGRAGRRCQQATGAQCKKSGPD